MDTNPLHLDAEAAKQGPFGERIAHGMLSAGLISGLLGTRLPGPGAIYMRQSRGRPPGEDRSDSEGYGRGDVPEPRQAARDVADGCTVGDELVIEGEAYVQVPSRG